MPAPVKSPVLVAVKWFAILVGLGGTLLCLMAAVGLVSDLLWVRFSVALVVAVIVPAIIADRLLPEADPKPKGLVTTVFALTWLAVPALFLFAAGRYTKPWLAAEGDRLVADGWSAVGEVSYSLAGERPPTPGPDPSAVASASAAPPPRPTTSDAAPGTPSSTTSSAPAPTAVATEPVPTASTTASAVATQDPPRPRQRAPREDCTYPPGPYGVDEGAILSPDVSWEGLRPGADEVATVRLRELFDCDGKGGIDAIVIDTSQYG